MDTGLKENLNQLTGERNELDRIRKNLQVLRDNRGLFASKAVRLAFMWMGKAKGELGSPNPYPESTNPSNTNIAPAVDVFSGKAERFTDQIVAIKQFRADLDIIIGAIKNDRSLYPANHWYQVAINQAYVNAVNAKMFLGEELGYIREEAAVKKKAEIAEKKKVVREAAAKKNRQNVLKGEITKLKGNVNDAKQKIFTKEKEIEDYGATLPSPRKKPQQNKMKRLGDELKNLMKKREEADNKVDVAQKQLSEL